MPSEPVSNPDELPDVEAIARAEDEIAKLHMRGGDHEKCREIFRAVVAERDRLKAENLRLHCGNCLTEHSISTVHAEIARLEAALAKYADPVRDAGNDMEIEDYK